MPAIDFRGINRATLARLPELVQSWMPGGKLEGVEYVVRNPRRHDLTAHSFSINTSTGIWADFASGDKGGDPVSLYAFINELGQGEAAKKLASLVGIRTQKDDKVEPIFPVPGNAPPCTWKHPKLGAPAAWFQYFDATGAFLGYVARINHEGGKDFFPVTFCSINGGERYTWRSRGFPEPRPLYRVHLLQPGLPTLICEGEKKADAAAAMFPGWNTVSPMNGAKSPSKTDWTPLAGSQVVIWPDHDSAGGGFAREVGRLCTSAKVSSAHIVDVPWSFPTKWDLADPPPEGITIEDIHRLVSTSKKFEFTAEETINNEVLSAPELISGSDVYIAKRVAKDLAKKLGQIIFDDGEFYHYTDNHWQPITPQTLQLATHEYDSRIYPTADGGLGRTSLSKSKIESIMHIMRTLLLEQDFFHSAPKGICCANGFVSFVDAEPVLVDHSPEHRNRHVLGAAWKSGFVDIPKNSLLSTLLTGCFKGDVDAPEKMMLIREIAGSGAAGLGVAFRQPKAFIFLGSKANNGKSQILDVLRGSIPAKAVCSVAANKFADEKYVVRLAGKLLNCVDELSASAAVVSEIFKQIVTGNPVSGRDLYHSVVEFRSIAQNVFATNKLPRFAGGMMDRGVLRRLEVLIFQRVIPPSEQIEDIGRKIVEQEADLLAQVVVDAASRLLKARKFTLPETSARELRTWSRASNPVAAFVAARVSARGWQDGESAPGYRSEIAYQKFRDWATASGFSLAQITEMVPYNGFIRALLDEVPKAWSKHTSKGNWVMGLVIADANARDEHDPEEVIDKAVMWPKVGLSG